MTTKAYAIGYVNFEKDEDASKAKAEMHGYNMGG